MVGWEGHVLKQCFARNCMKCADLQKKFITLTSWVDVVGGPLPKNVLLGIERNVQISKKKKKMFITPMD